MRRQFEGGVYRDQHTCSFNKEPFVCTYNAHAHTYNVHAHAYNAVDSLSCSEISRAGFIAMSWLKHAARFRWQWEFEVQ